MHLDFRPYIHIYIYICLVSGKSENTHVYDFVGYRFVYYLFDYICCIFYDTIMQRLFYDLFPGTSVKQIPKYIYYDVPDTKYICIPSQPVRLATFPSYVIPSCYICRAYVSVSYHMFGQPDWLRWLTARSARAASGVHHQGADSPRSYMFELVGPLDQIDWVYQFVSNERGASTGRRS